MAVDPITGAVSELLAHAKGDEAGSVFGLIPTIERMRSQPLVVLRSDDLAPGVFGMWRNYPDRDEVHYAPWVAAVDRTVAHEFGHMLLGHKGMSAMETATRTLPPEWHEMAKLMLRKCGQLDCLDELQRRLEVEAEAFASELCRRIAGAGGAPSARIRSLLNEAL